MKIRLTFYWKYKGGLTQGEHWYIWGLIDSVTKKKKMVLYNTVNTRHLILDSKNFDIALDDGRKYKDSDLLLYYRFHTLTYTRLFSWPTPKNHEVKTICALPIYICSLH